MSKKFRINETGVYLLKFSSACLLLFFLLILTIPLPDPLFQGPYATTLNSQEGILLSAAIAGDEQWRFPPSDSVPQKFKVAIRLFEDEYFYHHPGVNPVSMLRAVWQNFRAKKVLSGGSTLSMQTVRMATGNQPRTYSQKAWEMLAAFKLELWHSKETILKSYADHAPFGGNIVGLNAASWRYYGRPPYQLSWAEAATLAILPNDPASIFPGNNQEKLLNKRNRLLHKIHQSGYINEDEFLLAKEEPLPHNIKSLPNHAYHLLHRAMGEGHEQQAIHSTLRADLQYAVQQRVERYSRQMAANQIHNAAAIIVDIETGNTLAYVGNSNNPGRHGQHVDIITSRRSPGSLLKPFLYAAALDEGLIAPRQLLPDVPVFYKGFAPKNFDKEYRGAVPADDALISSLNVPFVHLLIEYGYEKFHQKLRELGFASFDQPAGHYGLSIILGGAETTLWEMTGVYAGMARAMYSFDHRSYQQGYSPADYHKNLYLTEETQESADQELYPDGHLRVPSIRFTLEAMQKLQRPYEEAGWKAFQSSRPISWKTGTSYGFRDGWAIGLNSRYVIGVWVGNADGEGRPGLTGVSAAAPLLFELFGLVDGDNELVQPFGMPRKICRQSGMIALEACSETYGVELPEWMTSAPGCTFHKLIHLNHEGTHQVNSHCYPVAKARKTSWFVLPPGQAWYYKKYHPNYQKPPPYLPGCSASSEDPPLELIYPQHNSKVHIPLEQSGERGLAIFQAAHQDKDAKVYWHLDEKYLGETQYLHQKGIQADPGIHTLTLIDDVGSEIRLNFEIIN